MPKTLKRATTVLALAALTWMITSGLLSFLAAAQAEIPEGVSRFRQEDSGPPVIIWFLVLGVVQMALCVVTRAGRNWARVALTVSAIFVSLILLTTVIAAVAGYLDATERAAVLGGEVRMSGLGITLIAIDVLVLLGTVIGIVGLYRRPVNAYFAEIRRARLGSGGDQPLTS
ncbi:hypothetical protein [Amycolatopsis azurea]|uniref:Uncharacterized protein n=1 Tax=Amycolatopsis azurea DSM 43854 TaxID=1238180 RepID=M2QDK2_9PSEU|nr:hypothetical protein [Amycolatopsis azurea]EMD30090.1 hypothetical protein C791_0075 [Amycolatopsis azurea DSM 43854]OOC07219.1 hypothetical protein B0293_09245 [Amycolatopsis azurea DSM 43854]